jgi:phosphoribosylformylglycinamidine cyclo-ligase
LTYAASGVDIDAADRAVDAIRDLVASTTDRPGVIGTIGGFGGLFELPSGYRRPVLVSSTDGVGTKMAVAMATGRFDTVGIDLVAMCVDDLVCCGARPLFFLDYQLLGRVDPDQVRAVLSGVAEGCRTAGCAIVGGELAEHPGLLQPGQIDLAGFAVGIVERDAIIDGPARTRAGDVLIGLASPGLRSNGYSLARRALLDEAGRSLSEPAWPGAGDWTLADELLRPSVIYAPAVLDLMATVDVHAVAHITGGGLPGNLPRVLGPGLDAIVERGGWTVPPIFAEIQRAGRVDDAEMARVFNLGVGMVVALDPRDVEAALASLAASSAAGRHGATVIGRLVPGDREVHLR